MIAVSELDQAEEKPGADQSSKMEWLQEMKKEKLEKVTLTVNGILDYYNVTRIQMMKRMKIDL